MNREILFRGKKLINGEWVEGDLFHHGEQAFIAADNRNSEVIPETVGQYTGLTDKNGVKIFEGDILTQNNHKYVVEWSDECAMFNLPCITDKKLESDFTIYYGYEVEVIGNIHDNFELLKGAENG